MEICNNQPNDGVGGGGGVGEAMRTGGTRGGGRVKERQIKKIERATGPRNSIAPAA
jgi:hypothetical protein